MAVKKQAWFEKGSQLEGVEEMYLIFSRLATASGNERMENKFLRIAEMLRRNVRNKINAVVKRKTGNLERSVVAKTFARKRYIMTLARKIIMNPAAFVAIHYRLAPHAHLIEFGHTVVRNGKVVGHAPARPFFRPTIESLRGQIKSMIIKAVKEEIEDAAKKGGGRR